MKAKPLCAPLLFLLMLLFPRLLAAQTVAAPGQGESIRVFIDCVNVYCDFDFFRTEINFIDYVRDRRDADVHVLITGENTGGGGRKYTVTFVGQKKYAGVDHLLEYVSANTSTEDEIRRGLAGVIKMGLIHYVAGTRIASQIRITRAIPTTPQKAPPVGDPWNYWFFRTSISARVSGEQLTASKYLYASVSANRVTDSFKVSSSASFSYRQSRYTFSDGSEYIDYSRSASAGMLAVKSLSPHWSAGGRISGARSTYLNQKLALRVAPAIEYNFYPYSESTRRRLTFNYSIGASHFQYEEETIYDTRRENLATQVAGIALNLKQPWGTTETSFEASQYLNRAGKNHLTLWNMLEIRLFKGFSFDTYGSVQRLRDQIYLPKAGATPEEVLVRRRQLATSYSYYISFGVSYGFGSIHNNIVNSRFTGF